MALNVVHARARARGNSDPKSRTISYRFRLQFRPAAAYIIVPFWWFCVVHARAREAIPTRNRLQFLTIFAYNFVPFSFAIPTRCGLQFRTILAVLSFRRFSAPQMGRWAPKRKNVKSYLSPAVANRLFNSGAISHVRFQARLGSLGLLVDPPGLLYNSDPMRLTFSYHFGGVEFSAVWRLKWADWAPKR